VQPAAAATGVIARQLWKVNGYTEISIASDGRTAAIAESQAPEIKLRDLTTGGTTSLAPVQRPAYAEWPVLSPDKKELAFAYAGQDTKFAYQLRVASAEPGGKARIINSATFPYLYVNGWAPDGSSVLVTLVEQGNSNRIGWMSTTDGRVTQLKSLDWRDPGRIALSTDGKFIAYSVPTEQDHTPKEIRILAADGSKESVLPLASGIHSSPIWSRDGRRLVFVSDRSGSFGIWSVPVREGVSDGPPILLRADVGDIDLIGFTVTDTLLYEHRVSGRDIYTVDFHPERGVGANPTTLLDTFAGRNWNPSLSPDGKSLAYLSRRPGVSRNAYQIVIRTVESGADRVIPTLFRIGAGPGGTPLWAPDGQTLYQAGRNRQNLTVVYKVDLKSGEVSQLIDTASQSPPTAALSLDGGRIYALTSGKAGVAVASYDAGTGDRTLFDHVGDAKGVSASPDGRSVAFVTGEPMQTPPRWSLFVANADGTNVRVLSSADKNDELFGAITWSPDSQSIYFQRRNGSFWRIPAAGGAPMPFGNFGRLVRSLGVSRDGRQLMYSTEATSDSVEIWALENALSLR
jgi:Tol biopolymer transport system component